jgi:SAM-dependent methyltransferase
VIVSADAVLGTSPIGDFLGASYDRRMSPTSRTGSTDAPLIAAVDTVRRTQRNPYAVTGAHLGEALRVITDTTTATYDEVAGIYADLRGEQPQPRDQYLNAVTLEELRRRPPGEGTRWTVLDVGAGYGRDIAYLNAVGDLEVTAVEPSEGFATILRQRAAAGQIHYAALHVSDMTDLTEVDSGRFDHVRMQASLHHLPLLPLGLGADAAVAEARRVLRPGGILHCLVKGGDGVELLDSQEGLGPRFYQYYSASSLSELLERHEFTVIRLEQFAAQPRPGQKPWVFALAVAV